MQPRAAAQIRQSQGEAMGIGAAFFPVFANTLIINTVLFFVFIAEKVCGGIFQKTRPDAPIYKNTILNSYFTYGYGG